MKPCTVCGEPSIPGLVCCDELSNEVETVD